jgi:cytochrome c
MKKIIVVFTISIIAYACGSNDTNGGKTETTTENKETSPESATPAVQDVTENPDYQKGVELIGKSDCLTCHKVDEKNIGPAYRDVANKYSNDEQTVAMLADKIIKGGKGVWGEIPMTPHPALPQEDARQMVKYILLLKK